MGFVKCPRCDLNYMQDTEQYCTVCRREVKGDEKEELFEMCSVCGENPVLPGKDLCLFCKKELGKTEDSLPSEDSVPADESALELDSTSNMDEITLDMENDEDIPQTEYGEISRELSLQKAIEDEEMDEDEAEEDL